MSFKKLSEFKICDELSHGYIEAFELPMELDRMKKGLIENEDDLSLVLRRPTENEIKAFGLNPDTTLIHLAYDSNKQRLTRKVVDNSTGEYDCLIFSQNDISDLLNSQDQAASSGDRTKDELDNSVGGLFAAYVAACQCREGFEFDNACNEIKKYLAYNLSIPGEVRRIVHCGLLQPESDLGIMAVEIETAIRDKDYVSEKFTTSCDIEESLLAEMLYILNEYGLVVDEDTAVRWLSYCCTRSAYFTGAIAPQGFNKEFETIFKKIDKALADHRFFSALIHDPEASTIH